MIKGHVVYIEYQRNQGKIFDVIHKYVVGDKFKWNIFVLTHHPSNQNTAALYTAIIESNLVGFYFDTHIDYILIKNNTTSFHETTLFLPFYKKQTKYLLTVRQVTI